jgi:ethanolamine utilization cobalamin adenosyltransferase
VKFITEEDLRDLYKIEPFTNYEIEPGTRITPGARQFLADRGILMFDEICQANKTNVKEIQEPAGSCSDKRICRKFHSKIMSMEAAMLVTSEELLSRDVLLAQQLIGLSKNFSEIKRELVDGSPSENLICKACTGIKAENFCDDLDDCFEITDFHIQLVKGKEIVQMHKLRCSLREFEMDVMKYFEGGAELKKCEEIVQKVHGIINTLSQLICLAAGGDKCQKKA